MPERAKTIIFYGVFALVFALYAIIVGAPLFGLTQISGATLALIASMTPLILDSLSLPGEVTPAILGGLMAYTAPSRASWIQTLLLVLLSGACWLMYLHLQVYLGWESTATALEVADVPSAKVADAVAALQSFANSVRSFAAVIFAAIVGLRLNDNVNVFQAEQATAAVPPAVPDDQQ